jgi:hypothetical protein
MGTLGLSHACCVANPFRIPTALEKLPWSPALRNVSPHRVAISASDVSSIHVSSIGLLAGLLVRAETLGARFFHLHVILIFPLWDTSLNFVHMVADGQRKILRHNMSDNTAGLGCTSQLGRVLPRDLCIMTPGAVEHA